MFPHVLRHIPTAFWLQLVKARQVRSQIPLRYLIRSWFEAGRRPTSNLSSTSFEPASNQLT